MVDDAALNSDVRVETRKNLKRIFEERYKNQASAKNEKKAEGVGYFFKKLRF